MTCPAVVRVAIPGPAGPAGPAGPDSSLSDSTPQTLGTAAAGTAATGSRSDHRHAMPNAAAVGADATGTAAAAVAAHAAAADPHPAYATAAEASAAAPVQSVAGRTGAVTLGVADVSGAASSSDARLSDAREWSAATATQAEAEAGSSTTRLAFTPQRVFQAVAAWWAASTAKAKLDGIATGATANATDAQLRDRSTHTGTQAVGTITGLGTLATQSGTFSGTSSGTNTGDQDLSGKANTGAIGSSGLTMATARLLGRTTASTGAVEEIQVSGGTFAAGVLTLSSLPASLTADGSGNLTFTAQWIQSTNGAASAPPHSLTGTWFTGGTATTTKPQFLIEPAGTTSNAWSTAGTGFGVNAASEFTGNLLDLQINGVRQFAVEGGGYVIDINYGFHKTTNAVTKITGGLTGSAGIDLAGTYVQTNRIILDRANQDVSLWRDAAGTLAQRNGTAAQASRIYNTYTSATNFERLNIRWTSNEAIIDTEAGSGGGTLRGLRIGSATTSLLGFYNATPVAQPAAVADATDAASVITQLNLALARLRTLGLIAT